ncbi:hypothetical protein BD309DRAFT_960260 [Dichomitus squalens]|uniref:Uncharacterized protein n=1 Tax=Dichomitus squalens TaxID=114155 RepID=A0A4Q9NQ30_9APHY|nr:hypothetical protein BD309DRAFT_960260 [Dichomitus squalens]TBU65474.1 hypothetical protein BD310DRAFT_911404 [Dichomitus squalens]
MTSILVSHFILNLREAASRPYQPDSNDSTLSDWHVADSNSRCFLIKLWTDADGGATSAFLAPLGAQLDHSIDVPERLVRASTDRLSLGRLQ